MSGDALLPCPFCGGVPETDSRQSFRAIDSGQLGTQAAIYCTGSCGAQMTLCHEDAPDLSADEALEVLVENWNHRCAS